MSDPERLRSERPERYEAILRAACAEFAQSGFERGNIGTIADSAGVAKGTIYNYCSSKEELFLHTVEFAAGQVIARMKSHVSPTASPGDRMRQFVMADLTFMDDNQDTYMLMISVFYGSNFLYGQGSKFLRIAMGSYREFFAMLQDICTDWMGADVVEARGGEMLGFQVLALIEAANLNRWANPKVKPNRGQDADRIMALLQDGLGPLKAADA